MLWVGSELSASGRGEASEGDSSRLTERRHVPGHGEVVVRDPVMVAVYRLIDRIAASDITVLAMGETGVGKDVVASAIHAQSPRRSKPYLRINCAALCETLLESELFGHEAGAFTGARGTKPGLLEAAHEGTVFLDEVGELPLNLQAKLLRVLESRELTRVGGLVPRHIDVRFVAATNRELEKEVARGTFRTDLFFRLNGATIRVPPLRERPFDIEHLSALFARHTCSQLGWKTDVTFTPDALWALKSYPWPGNAREIRNVMHRAVLLCQHNEIGVHDLSFNGDLLGTPQATALAARTAASPSGERERIVAALFDCAGNQTRAAAMLGMPRRTFVKRLVAYDIPRPRR